MPRVSGFLLFYGAHCMTQGKFSKVTHPESSSDDHRRYALIELANGLPVLAIQLPDTQQAAAAIAVRAGHFQDPQTTPGLAHFLEHMLFLGSDQYPEAESYSDFMSFAGGHHNAWTGTEHSNFYFELPCEHYADGLDRFSSLFRAPRFAAEWIEKERQAVEAEYRLKLKDELRRLYDVHKETSNPEHPFARFSVGNANTLVDGAEHTLREQLIKFYQTYYHAGNMSLVLSGPQTTDELLLLAEQYFADIPTAKEPSPAPTVPLYRDDQLALWINVKPLKEANRLLLTFALPSINDDYLQKTTSFIAHLLGYEGRHSLCSVLRQQGWITNLSAGGGASGSNFKDFNINIQLTHEGRAHEIEVIRLCFAYLELIRRAGLDPARYDERRRMVALAYQFPETLRAVDLASQLSVNLLHYAPEHVVSGDYRMDQLDTGFAQHLLSFMTPEFVRITRIHRDVKTTTRSTWYQAEYHTEPFTAETLNCLQAEQVSALIENFCLQLPPANPYIPERQQPLAIEVENQEDIAPTQYQITPALTLWHKQDERFRVPKGHLYLMLRLPYANASARNYACSRIWCELGLELLNEAFYDAEIAGIHFNLYPQQGGITLHLAGFSCKQERLFRDLVKTLGTLKPCAQSFEHIRSNLRDNWHAVHKNNPINHLFAMLHHQLQQGAFTPKQLAESLDGLDYEHFSHLLAGLFRDAQALMLVHGDWTSSQAHALAKHAAKHLPLVSEPATKSSRYVRRLPKGVDLLQFESSHPDHAAAYFIQGENTEFDERACFLLLNHLANPHFFSELRTRQQLGYLVGCSYVPMHGLPGILFYVQSPSTAPKTLSEAIENFLIALAEQLESIDEDTFNAAKTAVANHFFDADPSLRIRAQRYWQTITHNLGNFALAEQLGQSILSLDRQHFIARVQHHLIGARAGMELHTAALTDPA